VATAQAAGAILAHTLRAEGSVFKKGRVLAEADLGLLAGAGYEALVVARLAADDIAEDRAAATVGALVCGDGVAAAEPFTGRCNLYAKIRGLFVVDGGAVDALNRVDEAITLATIAPYDAVEAEAMVATAKIIPFAVSAAVLDSARRVCAGAPPLRIAAFRPRGAGLILTELPGLHATVLQRAGESQRVRLARYGATLTREIRCAHERSVSCWSSAATPF
jgi:molybdenum cofactor cytidylyltransferase